MEKIKFTRDEAEVILTIAEPYPNERRFRNTLDERIDRLDASGFIKQSALEQFQQAKKEFEESITKNMSTKELRNVLDLCDAAIKELQEKVK